jgi:hypothetical protein
VHFGKIKTITAKILGNYLSNIISHEFIKPKFDLISRRSDNRKNILATKINE